MYRSATIHFVTDTEIDDLVMTTADW